MNKFLQRALATGTALAIAGATMPAFAAESPVAVQLNGTPVTFADAVPQIKDNRTFLPFRSIFEALGAEVSYEDNVVTAVRGDRTVIMTIDSPVITIKDGDIVEDVEMDVVPYVDPETMRTYIPVRYAAHAMDCCVGWDQDAYTVVLIDPITMAEDIMNNYSFTYLEKLMAFNSPEIEGVHDTTATLDGALTIGEESVSFGATCNICSDETKVDANLKFTCDLSALAEDSAAEEELALLNSLATDGISFTLRGDIDKGVLYGNVASDLLALVDMNSATWYSVNLEKLVTLIGDLTNDDNGFSMDMDKLLPAVKNDEVNMDALLSITDADSVEIYDFIMSLISNLSDNGFQPGPNPDEYTTTMALDDASITCTFHMSGETVDNLTVDIKLPFTIENFDTPLPLSIVLSIDNEHNAKIDVAGSFTVESDDEVMPVSIRLTAEASDKAADHAVEVDPPAGVEIVDLTEIVNLIVQMIIEQGLLGMIPAT